MPRPSSVTALLLCGLLASGCATWDAQRCAQADWYRQGYVDGLSTWYSLIDRYNEACRPFGITPDAKRYKEGFDDGVWYMDHKPCAC